MDVLAKLGIDWRLLLAQIVNFLILLFVLRRFAYRPMLEFLEKRSKSIDDGLQNAKRAAEKLESIEREERQILDRAKKEANSIIAEARLSAERSGERIIAVSREEAERLLEEARRKLETEREVLRVEMRRELAGLVLLATEKVLQEKLHSEKDRDIVRKAIGELQES